MKDLKKSILSAGIALLLTIFFAYGTYVFVPQPDYDQCYMAKPLYREPFYTENGTYNETAAREFEQCNEKVNDERELMQLRSVTALTILGTLAIAASALLNKVPSVGSGVFAGGIMTVAWGTVSNWGILNKYLRLFLIALALGLLIYIGYKYVDRIGKKKHFKR